MAYNILKLFSIIFLFCTIFSPAETASTYSHYNCSNMQTFSPNSTYKINLNTLLSTLLSKASDTTSHGFYSTSTLIDKTETIYGLFMCNGYTNHCGECVRNSTKTLTSLCDLNKEAIIWSDECLVRYSNRSFFNIMEESPSWCVQDSMDHQGSLVTFYQTLRALMKLLLKDAEYEALKDKYNKFVVTKDTYDEDHKFLFGIAQCTPNLSKNDCIKCLRDAMNYLQTSCASGKIGGSVLYPSCIVRYDPNPFFPLTRGLNFSTFFFQDSD